MAKKRKEASFGEGAAVDPEEIEENVRVEYGKDKEIFGIEICNVAKMVAKPLAAHLKEAVQS